MTATFSSAEMHKPDQRCTDLIEITANSLSPNVVSLMLVAVQRDDNLELSINHAIRKRVLVYHGSRMRVYYRYAFQDQVCN